MMQDLTTNVTAFCGVLRDELHFAVGQTEAHDALRALEILGVTDEGRVRSALRLITCGSHEQTVAFDRAFDRFFHRTPRGAPQTNHQPRHSRPGSEQSPVRGPERRAEQPQSRPPGNHGVDADVATAAERRALDDEPDPAKAWQALRASFSPAAAARSQALQLPAGDAPDMSAAVNRVIGSVRLGRSRRWKAIERGGRFDVRRTIRASLQTAGDPVALRFLGHPLRNPRFVILIDGSRSMMEQTSAVLQFARALCRRWTRTSVFFFSTDLRDVSREFRAYGAADNGLPDLGHAWGGGTKIGANLSDFVRHHGPRLLTSDTLVMIYSDGLDAGDIPRLERALRDIDRRSAGIVWLNPHAALPGYRATARGMRAALPYITLLSAANDAGGFILLAAQLAANTRIRGHRR